MRRGATAVVGFVVLAACGGPGEVPAPEPASSAVLVPRHWDQACSSSPEPPAFRVEELFDTAGLGRRLHGLRLEPLPLAPPWPLYEFITRYDAEGRARRAGTWYATVDSAVARTLEAELLARVRPLPRLLEPAGVRSRIVFDRRRALRVARPVRCIPHMVHHPGERALGLPDDVTTWGGGYGIPGGDTLQAVVHIVVSPTGAVEAVHDVAGTPSALERVRRVIPLLRFEPALENGVPVEGELLQSFRFRRAPGSGPGEEEP